MMILTAHFTGCGEIGMGNNGDETLAVINTLEPQTDLTLAPVESFPPYESETPRFSESVSENSQSVSESSTESESANDNPENTPEWTENPLSGEFYVNTDNVYSRIRAIQGSEKVNRYALNDIVSVIAKTDTDYYKLADGTFIHKDYLSEIPIDGASDSSVSEPRPDSPAEPTTGTEDNTLEWTENPLSGEFYVNTDNVYSRIRAIQGSEKVNRYALNDKVTVTAKTDTDYYKLADGTFIHKDYLSENRMEAERENLGEDYTSTTKNGYVIERINGITYVDGIMIANKTYTLPASYDPGTIKEVADALSEMQKAAAKEGISLYSVSGYRSYHTQESVYAGWASRDGTEKADTYSSRAGHSDHQTGYTFDLNSLEQSFANTKEGIWLAEHCADFGFIIRYPEGKEMYTGYVYEPWHVRYIGKEKAKIITETGLSLEEYYGITSDYNDCAE